jgi:outer membrane protein TolC
MASPRGRVILAAWLAAASLAAPRAFAQSPMDVPAPRPVPFDEAVRQAIAANPTVERASTAVLSAQALLSQARASTMPTVDAGVSMTVLDNQRGFDGNVVTPQTQWLFAGAAAVPVLAMAQWAARAQAEDQVGIANLNVEDVRRQVGVSAAEAYLLILSAKRQQEVNERARDTALAQLDYARARREGGVGSLLNERRAAQEHAVNEELVERARLAVALGQEALGLLMAAEGPVDTQEEPSFDMPAAVGESWLLDRTDIRLFDARIDAAGRVVDDSWKDWVPTVRASFEPSYLTPASLFQPAGTWRAVVQASVPIFDFGRRKAVKAGREADLLQTRVDRREGELRARSGVRAARVTIDAEARALEKAREAAAQAAEVLRITDIAFRAGSTTNIELVDAQRSSRDAETAVRQAEDRARFARLALLVALGRFPK